MAKKIEKAKAEPKPEPKAEPKAEVKEGFKPRNCNRCGGKIVEPIVHNQNKCCPSCFAPMEWGC